jgi:hypothetical protein
VGGQRVNGEGERGWLWSMYFIYLHENRTMKPVEILLRREWGGVKENHGLDEFNQGIF